MAAVKSALVLRIEQILRDLAAEDRRRRFLKAWDTLFATAPVARSKGGAPRKHKDAEKFYETVRQEMVRLKRSGERRHGPKTAIRSLLHHGLIAKEGASALQEKQSWIASETERLYLVYDAGRHRGKK